MTKRIIITALVALAVLGALFSYRHFVDKKAQGAMAGMKPQPVTVSIATAHEETWPNTLIAIGTLESFRGITVKSELAGTIREVLAVSGAVVAQGDALVRIDTATEEALLEGLQAQAKLAEINLSRAKDLNTSGSNTRTELDTAEAAFTSAKAAVAQVRTTIAKKHISAPFAGRLGIVKVYPGQYLAVGDPLVVLECIDPIHVDFSLPQQDLSRLSEGQEVRLIVDTYPNGSFLGKITAISPRVSDATRSVDIRATLPNTKGSLRPGMYARVEVLLPSTEHAMVLPASAVVHNPYGETVYVVEKGIATQRFIKTGAQQGDLILVVSGLKAGEQVVTSGQIKLRNGSEVVVNNVAAPEANPAPKPNES